MERFSKPESSPASPERNFATLRTVYESAFAHSTGREEFKARIDKRIIAALKKYVGKLSRTAIIASLVGTASVEYAYQSTRYSIAEYESATGAPHFAHEDQETTAILDYLLKGTELPTEFRVAALRSKLVEIYRNLELPIPDKLEEFSLEQIRNAAHEMYLKDGMSAVDHLYTPEDAARDADERTENFMAQFTNDEKYSETPNPELSERLWRLLQEVGAPRIRWMTRDAAFYGFAGGEFRDAYYDPATNTMYIKDHDAIDSIVAEGAHAHQFHTNRYGSLLQGAHAWLSTAYVMARTGESRLKSYQQKYGEKDSLEAEAHSVIEPEFRKRLGLD